MSPLYDLITRFAATPPGTWIVLNIAARLDPIMARRTKGRFTFATLAGKKMALLSTIGAKSGEVRETPLLFAQDGRNIILIASYGGQPKNPAWYYNLRANPEVKLTIDNMSKSYLAREAYDPERQILWEKAVKVYPGYNIYQKRAGERKIPVIILSPLDARGEI